MNARDKITADIVESGIVGCGCCASDLCPGCMEIDGPAVHDCMWNLTREERITRRVVATIRAMTPAEQAEVLAADVVLDEAAVRALVTALNVWLAVDKVHVANRAPLA